MLDVGLLCGLLGLSLHTVGLFALVCCGAFVLWYDEEEGLLLGFRVGMSLEKKTVVFLMMVFVEVTTLCGIGVGRL